MIRVVSISSSRADVAILTPVWKSLAGRQGIHLHVVLTGMHLVPGSASVDLPDNVVCHRIGSDIGGEDAAKAARMMGRNAAALADFLTANEFDLMILMGDRLDMIPAAYAGLALRLPMAHLHGGELTFGAVDERARHAMTKLAHLHFCTSVDAAERIARMGEEPWRIAITGGPGLDNLRMTPKLDPDEFARELGLPWGKDFILCTVHPETNSDCPDRPLDALLPALDRVGVPALFTASNSDPAGRSMTARILEFCSSRPWTRFIETLGPQRYPSALRHVALMAGNSSSGIIEAGFFSTPVVDIGLRQDGRPRGANVATVANDHVAVEAAIRKALATGRGNGNMSLYGDGHAAERIAAIIENLPDRGDLLYKRFHDGLNPVGFSAPWN